MRDIESMRASDVMISPVLTVKMKDSIHDVASLFVDKNISGSVVVDDDGKENGVITKTDLARYDRERLNLLTRERDSRNLVTAGTNETIGKNSGFHLEAEEETIESWFSPTIYTLPPEATLLEVTNELLKRKIHHLFIKDEDMGKVAGVITTFDLVGYLSHYLLRDPKRRKQQVGS